MAEEDLLEVFEGDGEIDEETKELARKNPSKSLAPIGHCKMRVSIIFLMARYVRHASFVSLGSI